MAISIPIISTFSPKGVRKAIDEFKKLDGVAAKTGFVLGKAAMGATAAFAGLAAGAVAVGGALFKAAQAADADRKSQINLAATAQKFAKANKAQIAGLESTIEAMMLATGIADDDLRPSMSRLIRSFKDTDKASRALKIALDISGRTGKDLESVVEAMGKAADGSNTALLRLGTGLSRADLKGKDLNEIMALLEQRFAGGAADAANTFEGRLARLRARFGEMVESVGYKVLPIFEKLADAVIRIADEFGENGLSGAIKQFKAELLMADFASSGLGKFLGQMYDMVRAVYNLIADVPGVNLKKLPSWAVAMDRMREGAALEANKYMGYTPVSPGRFPAVLDQYKALLKMGMSPISAAQRVAPGININVRNGDPQAIVDALRRWSNQNGPVPIKVK